MTVGYLCFVQNGYSCAVQYGNASKLRDTTPVDFCRNPMSRCDVIRSVNISVSAHAPKY